MKLNYPGTTTLWYMIEN